MPKIAAILVMALALLVGRLDAGEAYVPRSPTVQAGPIKVSEDDVLFTKKKDYIHVLLNIYPYLSELGPLKLKGYGAVAKGLLQDEAAKRFAQAKSFKLDVAEIKDRDEYGALRLEELVIKGRFFAQRKGKKLQVTEAPL